MRRHLIRRSIVAAVLAGSGFAGLVGTGIAAHAASAGYVTVETCTTLAGTTHYSPGLLATKAKAQHAVLSGTVGGCSGEFATGSGGSFTAVLAGTASLAAENFGGTFTINWPAGTLNPSNGSLQVTEQAGVEQVSGSITSGALTGTEITLGYLNVTNTGKGTAKHPVTAQSFVNTAALAVAENLG